MTLDDVIASRGGIPLIEDAAGKDDWNKAHQIVANGEGSDCAWVHAHLHRVEGDLDNACYWYQQARHRGIGTPEPPPHLRTSRISGVDQVAFIQQGGKNRHDHICQSLELFAREVLPEFDEREEARAKRKQREMRFIEQAMTRKEPMMPLAKDRIQAFVALGRQVAATAQLTPEQEAARRRMLTAAQIPLENPAKAPAAE